MAPPRPVFGVNLTRLYERDGLAVPMVVYQCIQALDLFGLNLEGIYRLSGSVPHVNKLKNLFDTGTPTHCDHLCNSASEQANPCGADSGSNNLDFRNPENFFHDVNSVAGLLKQFFRDLPDPLLTRENYNACIEAASTSRSHFHFHFSFTNHHPAQKTKTTSSAATPSTPSSTACPTPTTPPSAPWPCTCTASSRTRRPTA